jgi:hypothetical protein
MAGPGLRKLYSEAFLGEVMIVRQHLRDVLAAHHLHLDTVRQAVAFVRTRFIQVESIQEKFMCRGDQNDTRIG